AHIGVVVLAVGVIALLADITTQSQPVLAESVVNALPPVTLRHQYQGPALAIGPGFFGSLHCFIFSRQPILIEVGGAAFVIGAVAVIQRQRWQRQAVALLQSLHLQFIHRANQPFGAVKLSLGVGGIHIGQLL